MPALLKIKRAIDNDIFKITFTLDILSLPESDKDLIRKFGEPQLNAGGTFLADTENEFVLPDKYIRVRSDLPFTQEFDSKSIENAGTKALAYQTAFQTAYAAAFTELRANTDNFTGEHIVNI